MNSIYQAREQAFMLASKEYIAGNPVYLRYSSIISPPLPMWLIQ